MPRQKLITPARALHVHLPEDLLLRLDLYLMSTASGEVPRGAYQKFFISRIEEFFATLKPKEEV